MGPPRVNLLLRHHQWLSRWARLNDGRRMQWHERLRWMFWRWWYERTHGRIWSSDWLSVHYWRRYGVWVPTDRTWWLDWSVIDDA